MSNETQKHTPGPWLVNSRRRHSHEYRWEITAEEWKDAETIAIVPCRWDTKDFSDLEEANARRIVACVNACEGLTTEQVENLDARGALSGLTLRNNEIAKIAKQRDELLAALEAVAGFSTYDETATEEAMCEIQTLAMRAIAKVRL